MNCHLPIIRLHRIRGYWCCSSAAAEEDATAALYEKDNGQRYCAWQAQGGHRRRRCSAGPLWPLCLIRIHVKIDTHLIHWQQRQGEDISLFHNYPLIRGATLELRFQCTEDVHFLCSCLLIFGRYLQLNIVPKYYEREINYFRPLCQRIL